MFPVLVLAVFTLLVVGHSNKLFAPSDFKNEDNFVKMQLSAVASLAVATTKREAPNSEAEIQNIVNLVQTTASSEQITLSSWKNHILWVDDRPDNNIHERRAFEAFGIKFTLALSTNEALQRLNEQKFVAIISDMGRVEGAREGYVLLDSLRERGNFTPLFFYASSNSFEHKQETKKHGGQGCTNDAQELFQMVMASISALV